MEKGEFALSYNKRKSLETIAKIEQLTKKLRDLSSHEPDWVLQKFHSTRRGLSEKYVEINRSRYGENVINSDRKTGILSKIISSVFNGYNLILVVLAIFSFVTDHNFKNAENNSITGIIILAMVAICSIMRFIQSMSVDSTKNKLSKFIEMYVDIERRESGREETLPEEIVAGDIIHLVAGDMVPADVRIIRAKDFFVSQPTIAGETIDVEKCVCFNPNKNTTAAELKNIAFMGSTVLSGSAVAVAVAVGNDTIFGVASNNNSDQEAKEENEIAQSATEPVTKILLIIIAIMMLVVLIFNGCTTGDWQDTLLYIIAMAVGLTPQMLPLIVTTCFSRGTVAMSEKKCIAKTLTAIKNLSSMNTLCIDKTGTVTQNKVALSYHLDIHGNEEIRVLKHGFLNSFYQTGLKNLTDIEIINQVKELENSEPSLEGIFTKYTKQDEIPFDFTRRRMSVVVKDQEGKTQMITKGAVEKILEISRFAEYEGRVEPLTDELKQEILSTVKELNHKGLKVLAVAQKTNPSPIGEFCVDDEAEMVLLGYLAFLDSPRTSSQKEITRLNDNGVTVKLLTGDSASITKYVCRQVGINYKTVITGEQIENMTQQELSKACLENNVFANLTPLQKAKIIECLQENKKIVGYLGDGINDSEALKTADVAVSTTNAVDTAKENADIILTEKNLRVLADGLLQARKTFVNITKYVKLTVSSNFGNMLSIMFASILLPFLPMTSVQLLILNLVYELSCTAIAWDNVDMDLIHVPRLPTSRILTKFMVWIGLASTIFDLLTFALLYYVICPNFAVTSPTTFLNLQNLFSGNTLELMQMSYKQMFRAGWLVESIWTQVVALLILRTPKTMKNSASVPMFIMSLVAAATINILVYTNLGSAVGLVALPIPFYIFIIGIMLMYTVTIVIVKKAYIKHYGRLI